MSTTFLTALQSPLKSLAETSPVPADQICSKVEECWQQVLSDHPLREGDDKQLEVIKSVLELVSRELTVQPLSDGTLLEPSQSASDEEKQAFQEALQYRLDIVLALFESAYASLQKPPAIETGAMFLPLLEDLVDLMSVESWRDLWRYVETRSKRFTQDMPASKGKALPLLRTINAFLRSLPRTPEDLIFRGRVHQFASSVISIADKSAINLRGDYNELKTVWDEEDKLALAETKEDVKIEADPATADAEGDVKMDGEVSKAVLKEGDAKVSDTEAKPESNFYSTLWSLQQYFAHPPSLAPPAAAISAPQSAAGSAPPTPFATFKEKSDLVLPILFEQTKKQKELMGREVDGQGGRKRKREASDGDEGFFYPRYLTGKRLLEHELADPSFRRQILVQYFILFQFLLNLTPAAASKQAFTGGMPKNFVIESQDEAWVKEKVSAIREELRKMPGDGVRFEKTVLSIITREFHYATWKNEGCPEGVFEVPPLDKASAHERAQLWKRRLAPPRRFRFNVGTMSLSDMWRGGYSDIDQLRNWKRKSDVDSLYKEIEAIDADEADDKAMGEVPAEKFNQNEERRTSLTWRAMRLRTQTDIRSLSALKSKRNLHILFKPPPPKVATLSTTTETEVKTEIPEDKSSSRLPTAGGEAEDGPKPEVEADGENGIVDDVERSEDVTGPEASNGETAVEEKKKLEIEAEVVNTPNVDEEMPAVSNESPSIAPVAESTASAPIVENPGAAADPTKDETKPTVEGEAPTPTVEPETERDAMEVDQPDQPTEEPRPADAS